MARCVVDAWGVVMKVALHNLTVSYQRRPAVHHVSVEFPLGTASAVFGPNGAGKSTILKAMMGLVRPDHGRIELQGLTRQQMAYLPQASGLDRSLPVSVLDTVLAGAWHRVGVWGGVGADGVTRALAALASVGLHGFEARGIGQLSGGQFQRVLFARILMQDAQLILLDEPFASVDSKTTHDLLALVQHWVDEGRTVIAVLHDAAQVRSHFSHTLLIAREPIAWGRSEDVLTEEQLLRANHIATHWLAHPPVCRRDDSMEAGLS